MNILHYAVLNQNQELVETIVCADAENDKLLYERNYRNQTPAHLDFREKYEYFFNHIWASASTQTQQGLEYLGYVVQ